MIPWRAEIVKLFDPFPHKLACIRRLFSLIIEKNILLLFMTEVSLGGCCDWIWWIHQPASPNPFRAGCLSLDRPDRPSLTGVRPHPNPAVGTFSTPRGMIRHPHLVSMLLKRNPVARGKRAPHELSIVGWF